MYKKILIPLDGSEFAECSLEHVRNLSRMGNRGEVILLHVLDSILWCRQGCDFVAARNIQYKKAETYLEEITSRFSFEGIETRSDILEGGMPASAIVKYAEDNGVDLIVITTRGHAGMKRLMLGSVALEVLHDSHVPVLLIRPEPCRQTGLLPPKG